MKILTQQDLAAAVGFIFKDGYWKNNALTFMRLSDLEPSEASRLLQEVYKTPLAANYSFETSSANISSAVHFFMNADKERQKTHFLVFNEHGNFLGRCVLKFSNEHVFLGYAVCASQQNKGYGTTILKTLLRLCFEHLGLEHVYGTTMSHNIRSQKVMEKSGMIPYGVADQNAAMALDTRELSYTISLEHYKSSNKSLQRHPGSRALKDVIMEDYLMSLKMQRNYDTAAYARINFFLQQPENPTVSRVQGAYGTQADCAGDLLH